METEDVPEGEAFTSDTQIVRWAVDPSGRICQISAEAPGPPDWPIFTPDADDGPMSRLLLWRVNRLLRKGFERGERRRSGPPNWYLEVWRHDEDGQTLLVEEKVSGSDEARLRVHELSTQVATGIVEETD